MKTKNSDSGTIELVEFILENNMPFDVTIEEILKNGPHPNFFIKDFKIEKFKADDSKNIDGISYESKQDAIYMNAQDKAIIDTTIRLPDYYDDFVDVLLRSGKCSSRKMAYVYLTSAGFLPAIKSLYTPENRAMPIYREIGHYIQRCVPFIKEDFAQSNLGSLSESNIKLTVDEKGTHIEHVYFFKIVAEVAGEFSHLINIPVSEIYKLMICEAVSNSGKR